MPPKKATAAAPKKAAAGTHPSYKDMIKEAIIHLKDRSGSSRQAIKKYIQANNKLGSTSDAQFNLHISQSLASGEKSGEFLRPKGPSGPVKLGQKKAAAPKKAKATTTTATKKTTTAKKPAAAKKTKTTTAKKAAPKTKANTAKPRKAAPKKAAPAPAVEAEKKPVVLGKTKSGRVTKSKQPETAPKAKKAGVRKIGTTKKAAAKKEVA